MGKKIKRLTDSNNVLKSKWEGIHEYLIEEYDYEMIGRRVRINYGEFGGVEGIIGFCPGLNLTTNEPNVLWEIWTETPRGIFKVHRMYFDFID